MPITMPITMATGRDILKEKHRHLNSRRPHNQSSLFTVPSFSLTFPTFLTNSRNAGGGGAEWKVERVRGGDRERERWGGEKRKTT